MFESFYQSPNAGPTVGEAYMWGDIEINDLEAMLQV